MGTVMASSRINTDQDETDDLLMNEDADFIEEEQDEADVQNSRSKSFNLDMRHRIENRLEERRLQRELNEYEFFELDDEDTVH
ncbi:PA3496 family putative envelope integrity protein [Alcanivorax sp. 1008]|uniref:PA3496 family putative envelope integrity protein n=1 Tax=Alcanivorax sp. 1008 TaxID=2816853 RepID=UPI001E65680D|nr:hypothetical protein [Alcanivorax sp. 1008]